MICSSSFAADTKTGKYCQNHLEKLGGEGREYVEKSVRELQSNASPALH